jgi:hypothetical protein
MLAQSMLRLGESTGIRALLGGWIRRWTLGISDRTTSGVVPEP